MEEVLRHLPAVVAVRLERQSGLHRTAKQHTKRQKKGTANGGFRRKKTLSTRPVRTWYATEREEESGTGK